LIPCGPWRLKSTHSVQLLRCQRAVSAQLSALSKQLDLADC